MKRALVASAALHVVLGALLLSRELHTGAGAAGEPPAISVEIVAPPAIAVREAAAVDVQGGGAAMTRAHAPGADAVATQVASRGDRRGRATSRARVLARAQLADFAIDRGTDGDGCAGCGAGVERDGDGGEGDGAGGHRGRGIGFGDGGRIAVVEQALVMPEPIVEQPVSKARPAKLIYPTRQRDLGEDRLFVARVTVDTDGFVVGARLVRGRTGPRDDEAADLIFRFRYLPALDDAGRAIRSTFDQPFHVGR